MFENYLILLLVFPTYIYLGKGHEQHQCFSQSDEISIIYPEYSNTNIWNGRTTFIYIFRPFPIPILSAFLSYYIKYMFETLYKSLFYFQLWISCDCKISGSCWNKAQSEDLPYSIPRTLKRTKALSLTQLFKWLLVAGSL